MTPNDAQDVASIISGYDQWRRNEVRKSESAGYDPLGASAYLDALAAQRALDVVQQIEQVYNDPDLTWQEIDQTIRQLLGVK